MFDRIANKIKKYLWGNLIAQNVVQQGVVIAIEI
jgi:hypothetical protein